MGDTVKEEELIEETPPLIEENPREKLKALNEVDAEEASKETIEDAPKIAYVVPIVECPITFTSPGKIPTQDRNDYAFYDALVVLKHSIHRNSVINSRSKYNYEMIAIIHETVTSCFGIERIPILQKLGYKVNIVGTPLGVQSIDGGYLRGNIPHTNHGGEKDWSKIYSYSLDYPLVVLTDIRTLFMKPLDDLFDIMLQP